uniref:Putative DNA repair protein n=1 Tax=viral metagenome TaxID=1070528 RepID=A0A6M3IM43_9ZZZZ
MSKKFWKDLESGKFALMVKESSRGQKLQSSKQVYNIMKPMFAEKDDVETMYVIFMTAKNDIISIEKMFSGSISSTMVYPREIVKKTLELKAAAIAMVHNHPSGDVTPSPEDLGITRRVALAMACIGATLHDHIIIGDGYHSMADTDFIGSRIKLEIDTIFNGGY